MAEITIYPSDDSVTRENHAATIYGDADYVWVQSDVGQKGYSYFKFDVSGIPEGATISSAILYVYVNAAKDYYSHVSVYKPDADIDEDTLTWANQPGVDGAAIFDIDLSTAGWKNSGSSLTDIVKDWHDGDINNYGITLREDAGDIDGYSRMDSKETLTPARKPYFIVTYAPPSGGGFSGFSPWIFMKDAWEKHNKIFKPKGILIPKGI